MNITDPSFNQVLQQANAGDIEAQLEVADSYYNSGNLDKAHHYYSRVINSHENATAFYGLGRMLYVEKYPEENYALAEQYFSKATDLGNTNAAYYLAEMYMDGIGVPQDQPRAVALMEGAAAQGNMYAQRAMGWQYLNGLAVKKDVERARELFQKAADQGEPWSKLHLGRMYDRGVVSTGDINQDAENAVRLIKEAADADIPDAQYTLSSYYEKGIVVPQDNAQAFQMLLKAANNNHSGAQNLLGAYYCDGKLCDQDYSIARQWFEKAASNGHTIAMKNLARMFSTGTGLEENPVVGFEWMMKAAQAGDAEAQDEIGIEYCSGQVVDQNYSIARSWYEKSAAQGYSNAMYHLFQMISSGDGCEKNEKEAYEWLLKAAQNGDVGAQVTVGLWNCQGKDFLAVNYDAARYWFEKAAEAGDPEAMHDLAVMYGQGMGVEKNEMLQEDWTRKAAIAGYEVDIAYYISQYAKNLSRIQMERSDVEMQRAKRVLDLLDAGYPYEETQAISNREYVMPDVPQNEVEEYKKWIEYGLRYNNCFAKYQYGYELIAGRYYPQNIEQGIQYLNESANSRSELNYYALEELAEIYSENKVVPRNPDLALQYAQRYIDSGQEDGSEVYNRILSNIGARI